MADVGGWDDSPASELERVLGAADDLTRQGRDAFGPDRDAPEFRRCFAVRSTGRELIGVACVYESRWHPLRLWFFAEVAAARRRCGHGTALLAEARRACPDDRPLRAKVFANSPGARFAEARGFRVLQVSRTVRVDTVVASRPASAVHIRRDAEPALVAEAFLRFYEAAHRWDPVGRVDASDMQAVSVDTAAATLLGSVDGEPVAVACLYYEPGGLLFSGGPVDGTTDTGVADLLDAAIGVASAAGRPLLVEVDSSMTGLSAELNKRLATVLDEVHIVGQ